MRKCDTCNRPCFLDAGESESAMKYCPLDGTMVRWKEVDEKTNDPVNNPSHYNEGREYNPIDVIWDWGFGREFCLGNTIKYISRAGRKGDEIEDLKKGRYYLDYCIKKLEEENGN